MVNISQKCALGLYTIPASLRLGQVKSDEHDDEIPAKAAEQLALIKAAIEALHREEYKSRDIALAGSS